MSKYYISNNIQFMHSTGEMRETPDTATKYTRAFARHFLSAHPDHTSIIWGSSSGKKRSFVLSTQQKFVGGDGIVTEMARAKHFATAAEAFEYLHDNPGLISALGEPQVIDEKYRRFKTENIKQKLQNLTTENTKRIQFSPQTKRILYGKSQVCGICGKPLDMENMSIDHIVPLNRGGTNDISNLRPTHLRCNMLKGNMTDEELIGTVTDIGCNMLVHSPDPAITAKYFRAFVRSVIAKKITEKV